MRARCEACGQKMPVRHKFPLNSTMAISLINLYRLVDGDTTKYVHVSKVTVRHNNNFATMRWWGLVARATKHKGDRAMWRITKRGVLFVRDRISISKYMIIERDQPPLEYSDELIDIRGALRNRFNYDELFTA